MATSNHQATSNFLNTHQIQHPGRPILCFTNRFTNHFTTKGCTKPNFYQYQPKICNAFTRTKLLLSIFCGAKRQIFAQLLPLFVFHYKAKIRTLQQSVMLKCFMTNQLVPYRAYSPHRQAEKERIKNQKHGDLRMVILRREEFSSSELNVRDVSSTHSEQVEPRTASLWGECSNSWAIMQEEDKSHPSSNE